MFDSDNGGTPLLLMIAGFLLMVAGGGMGGSSPICGVAIAAIVLIFAMIMWMPRWLAACFVVSLVLFAGAITRYGIKDHIVDFYFMVPVGCIALAIVIAVVRSILRHDFPVLASVRVAAVVAFPAALLLIGPGDGMLGYVALLAPLVVIVGVSVAIRLMRPHKAWREAW